MNVIQKHIDYLDKSIKTVREIIDSIISPYENAINLLCFIPVIKRNSSITIISEIGTDMSQFSSHYRLTSWAGLAPGCNESRRRGKKCAYIAIARKILVAIYHMLSTGIV